MKKLLPILLVCSPLFAGYTSAAEAPEEEVHKEGLDYFAFNAKLIDFRSIGEDQTGSLLGSEVVAGTYLTDYVTVETRGGWGWQDDEIEPGLDIGLKYWFSWYMGLNYPLTDYFEVYGKYGFSFVKGYSDKADEDKFEDIPEDFLSSTFSMSWAIGGDYRLSDSWYLSAEIGRLHRDTTTDIKTLQSGLGLKFQF
jgi:opacity protein-like surface antigen